MEVFCVNISGLDCESDLKCIIRHLSYQKRMRVDKILCNDEKKRILCGELLIRCVANRLLGMKFKDIEFVYNDFGKPYIKGYERFYFNISHSFDWIVCIVNSYEVGIDIEKIRNIDLKIARRFFAETEIIDLECMTGKEQIEYFYDLWTLKESYIKYLGKGLFVPLNSFSIKKIYKDNILLLKAFDDNKPQFKQYEIDIKYKCSICSDNIILHNGESICKFEIQQLLFCLKN